MKFNFSKIPVYSKKDHNIVGYIKVKNLLVFKEKPNVDLKSSGIILPIVKLN
jgi:CBS domain containing-hemolysin-like protein